MTFEIQETNNNTLFSLVGLPQINWSDVREEIKKYDASHLYRKVPHRWRSQVKCQASNHILHMICAIKALSVPLDIIESIIKSDKSCLQTFDQHGWLVLHRACEGGNMAVIELILNEYPQAAGKWSRGKYISYLPIQVYLRNTKQPSIKIVRLLLEANSTSAREASKLRYKSFDVLDLLCDTWKHSLDKHKQSKKSEKDLVKW